MSHPEVLPTISLFLPNRGMPAHDDDTAPIQVATSVLTDDIAEVNVQTIRIAGNMYASSVILPPLYLLHFEKALGINHEFSGIQERANENPHEVYSTLGNFCMSLTKEALAISIDDSESSHSPVEAFLDTTRLLAYYALEPVIKLDPDENDIHVVLWTTLGMQASEQPAQIASFRVQD